MKTLRLPEIGYTPKNLKALLHQAGLKREDCAELLDIHLRQVHRWCVDVERDSHQDMPLARWHELIEKIDFEVEPETSQQNHC